MHQNFFGCYDQKTNAKKNLIIAKKIKTNNYIENSNIHYTRLLM